MKRITLMVLVLAALAFGLASCDNGSTSGGGGSDHPLIGTWVTYWNGELWQEIEFRNNGKFTVTHFGYNYTGSGTYSYNESFISFRGNLSYTDASEWLMTYELYDDGRMGLMDVPGSDCLISKGMFSRK